MLKKHIGWGTLILEIEDVGHLYSDLAFLLEKNGSDRNNDKTLGFWTCVLMTVTWDEGMTRNYAQ